MDPRRLSKSIKAIEDNNNNASELQNKMSTLKLDRTASWNNANPALAPETSKNSANGSNKFIETIRCSKRRLIQQVLVKLKQAEETDDSEYKILRERQNELHDHVVSTMTYIKSFATNLVALGYGATLLGESSANVASTTSTNGPQSRIASFGLYSNNEQQPAITGPPYDPSFTKNMSKVDSTARELAGTVLSSVVAGIQKKLDSMTTLKKEMEDREKLKLDFDSAVRKLRLAKEKGQPEDVVRRDIKLQAARNALNSATEAIVHKFLYYENARSTLISSELQQFRELQAKFFTFCATSFQVQEKDATSCEGGFSSNQNF